MSLPTIEQLTQNVVARRRLLERFFSRRVLPAGIWNSAIRHTRHYREWYRAPMNYVRIMELPLAWELLDTSPDERVADLSSPKLLALYLAAHGWSGLTIADIEDYFVNDFEVFSRQFRFTSDLRVIDARQIPLADAALDRVFSVSVFEHIPNHGDREAAIEVARVLKPGGVFVVTLPAYREYMEEWKNVDSYWDAHSVRNETGRVFFQRRYDRAAIDERFGGCGFEFADVVYVAERPIAPPQIGADGRLWHNVYLLQEKLDRQRLRRLRRRVPLLEYAYHRSASHRHQYLTRDAADPNVRQVALKLVRT